MYRTKYEQHRSKHGKVKPNDGGTDRRMDRRLDGPTDGSDHNASGFFVKMRGYNLPSCHKMTNIKSKYYCKNEALFVMFSILQLPASIDIVSNPSMAELRDIGMLHQ